MFEDVNIVVGAGISGAVIARKLAEELNEKVLILDKKNFVAGNCHDYKDNNGITVHKYGSHIFHTNNSEVWNFLSRFTSFYPYMHRVFAKIDGIDASIPFNLNTLFEVFPSCIAETLQNKLLEKFEYNSKIPILELQKYNDKDLKFLADYIYQKVFLNYTMKQWGKSPTDIDRSVTARVPVLIGKDSRYFQDKYQGIPVNGYTKLIENLIAHSNIEIKTGVDYTEYRNCKFKRVFYTGSIDEFFNYQFGILPYRSVSFEIMELNCPYFQKNSVVNYPNNYDFTRIHEYKHYLGEQSEKTIIAKEYSHEFELGKNERYYPIVNDANMNLYNKYKSLAQGLENVYFLGRLGDYKYYDMDKAVERALDVCNSISKDIKSTIIM